MHQLVRNLNITLLGILLFSIIMLNVNYFEAEHLLKREIEANVTGAATVFDQEVDYWADTHALILGGIGDAITVDGLASPEKIRTLLSEKGRTYPEFITIYFGMPDGSLIISNDWEPSEGFDLTVRPWYVGALENNSIIITEPFEDDYTHKSIVSIAMPVYDDLGQFLGVISGDIALDTVEAHLEAFLEHIDGNAYVLNASDEVLIEMESVTTVMSLEKLKTLYAEMALNETTDINNIQMTDKNIYGTEGYFHSYKMPYSQWSIISFSPLKERSLSLRQMKLSLYTLIALLSIVFYLVHKFQSHQVSKPLVELTTQIANIDVENVAGTKIKIPFGSLFEDVETQLNKLFEKQSSYIFEINNDKEEMQALNEELEASFNQVVAIEQEVSMQKLSFEALFRNSKNALVMFDAEHKIIDMNVKFRDLFGYSLESCFGVNLDEIVTGKRMTKDATIKTKELFDGKGVYLEAIRFHQTGREIECAITGVPIMYEGRIIGGFGIYQDISERKAYERQLEFFGTHDYLTEIYNRRFFENYIIENDCALNLPIGIIIVDINGLKLINDAFGSEQGDKVLIGTANELERLASKQGGIAARIGGDEFALVFINKTKTFLEEISNEINAAAIDVKIGDIYLSLAVGNAIKSEESKSIHAVVKDAEDAMFKQKLKENPIVRGKTVKAIMNTLHEKSNREEQHSKRVADLCYGLGKRLNLADREVTELKILGLMHDVGKIVVDGQILNKPGKLNDEEFEAMKKHPESGYRILSSVTELSEIASHVLAHHERWDGKGYPKGIKGRQIPYLARIVSVVDAYDAMTSDRSYRQGISKDEAIKELENNAGTQFDPNIVTAFVSYLLEEPTDA